MSQSKIREAVWSTLPQWTAAQRAQVAHELAAWASRMEDASTALSKIEAGQRVLVWLACASARVVLAYASPDDVPRTAIETAERWVRGEATSAERDAAAHAAWLLYQEPVREVYAPATLACVAASALNSESSPSRVARYAAHTIVQAKIAGEQRANQMVVGAVLRAIPAALDAAARGYAAVNAR